MNITRGPKKKKRFVALQQSRGRKPILLPKIGGETRWDLDMDEVERGNIIMGDMCDTITALYSHGGEDYDKLTTEEQQNNDISRVMFSNQEKRIMRHFEGGASIARELSKFLQDRKFLFSYVLFESRLAVDSASEDFFGIVNDVSHSHSTVDLRARGNCVILVKKLGALIDDDIEKSYVSTETMESSVAKFHQLYSTDLTDRLQLDENVLPEALSIPTLLNPAFGMERRIIGSGLMTSLQHLNAKGSLISLMQTILDRQSPVNLAQDSSEDHNSDNYDSKEDELPEKENVNHQRAVAEFNDFESFKMSKYHPKVIKLKAKTLIGEDKENCYWSRA